MMSRNNSIAGTVMSVGLYFGVLSTTSGLAQPPFQAVGQLSNRPIFAAPPPPKDYGEPGGRKSAGSRKCSATSTPDNSQLTALVPLYQREGETMVGGLTTQSHPTFWFYVPSQLGPDGAVEFVLQDDQENYIYKTKMTEAQIGAGILSISLPAHTQLQANQIYRWHFLLYCQSKAAPFISGFIQRVIRPDLVHQLSTATPREKVRLYGQAGIWYDALTQLAGLYRQDPKNNRLQKDWKVLMQEIQLPEFIEVFPLPFPKTLEPIPQQDK